MYINKYLPLILSLDCIISWSHPLIHIKNKLFHPLPILATSIFNCVLRFSTNGFACDIHNERVLRTVNKKQVNRNMIGLRKVLYKCAKRPTLGKDFAERGNIRERRV